MVRRRGRIVACGEHQHARMVEWQTQHVQTVPRNRAGSNPATRTNTSKWANSERHTMRSQKPCLWEFKSPLRHQSSAVGRGTVTGRTRASVCASCSALHRLTRSLLAGLRGRYGIHGRLAQRQSTRFTCEGSGFQNSHRLPTHALLAHWESAALTWRRYGVRSTDDAPTCTCSSVAEQSADNRQTRVQFSTGAPFTGP